MSVIKHTTFEDKRVAENFRALDEELSRQSRIIKREIEEICPVLVSGAATFYLGLDKEPWAILLSRLQRVPDEGTPAAALTTVFFVWEGDRKRARMLIASLTAGIKYRFRFLVVE